MRTYCKNCMIECWKGGPKEVMDELGLKESGFSENCGWYIDKMTRRTIEELNELNEIEEDEKREDNMH
jgi:hypothetical protein